MAQGYVRHFMRQNPGHFGLAIGRFDQSSVHVHGAAGERECINRIFVHQLEIVKLCIGLRSFGEPPADLIQPGLGLRILDDFHLALDLRVGFFAELDLLIASVRGPLNSNFRLFGWCPLGKSYRR